MFLKVLAEATQKGGATGSIAKKANGAKVNAKAAKKARVKKNTRVGKKIYNKADALRQG